MSELYLLIAVTLVAGLTMPAGAILAVVTNASSKQTFRHTMVAFGGGALLSAVSMVLVPDGSEHLSIVSVCVLLALGGYAFLLLDRWLAATNTPASQLAAMLSDFIPESIALGAAFAIGNDTAFLLAFLIELQNLPEGFNAYLEMAESSVGRAKKTIAIFAVMALLGPISGGIGYIWLAEEPEFLGGVMMFAAGGILYSVFQDIAPNVPLERHWRPPMGAVFGFMLGVAGSMWVAGA